MAAVSASEAAAGSSDFSTPLDTLTTMKESMAALGLSAAEIKLPVSLVDGKRPAVFSPRSSRNRLRFLQNICSLPRDGSGQPDGILVVPGVDGDDNIGARRIINYLFKGKW